MIAGPPVPATQEFLDARNRVTHQCQRAIDALQITADAKSCQHSGHCHSQLSAADSEGDPVLHWAFPLGETAGGEGVFPTAVGRTGGPAGTWHAPLPMAHDGKPYVHGSYWPGDESSTAVAFALRIFRSYLGIFHACYGIHDVVALNHMKIKTLTLTAAVTIAFAGSTLLVHSSRAATSGEPGSHPPVLVELFTSEGCSSCPPADALLEKLDRANNPGRPEVIVLSEHVDYWNYIGWKDQYSSPKFSERQGTYSGQFHLNSVYTPEMVVDGAAEFVGNDAREARSAIAAAAQMAKIPVRVIAVSPERVRVEVDAFPPEMNKGGADVILAIASSEASTQVLRGENSGRKLHHVAVARSITPIGEIHEGEAFSKEISLKRDTSDLRVIAWVQRRGQGRVLGSIMQTIAH